MNKHFLTGILQNTKRILLLVVLLLGGEAVISAQAFRDTDHRADKNLKSNARVNPSTLAMEFSLPLMAYPGRGGNSFPFTFNYSSKLWTMRFPNFLESFVRTDIQGGIGSQYDPYRVSIITSYQTQYSERAFSGWNVSGMQPITQMENDGFFNFRDEYGNPYINYINRVRIQMPDGSTKEFRANDKLFNCGGYPTNDDCNNPGALGGTFLSADGSGMRYVRGTLSDQIYLPDGGLYRFTASGNYEYIDKNGNKTVYDQTANKITDTLGREIINPLAAWLANPGNSNFNLPGLGGQNLTYGQKWGQLKPAGCVTGTEAACQDAGLENPSDALYYLDNDTCADRNWDNPINSSETFLFQVNPPRQETRIEQVGVNNVYYLDTYKDRMCYSSGAYPVNPNVLTEVTLPDGSKYKFRYNRFGEMTKIIYPTGAYERFRYDQLILSSTGGFPFNQTSRGVVERWISEDGVTETQNWKYSQIIGGTDQNGFGLVAVSTLAPDGTKTLRTTHNSGNLPFYEDPRAGMPFDEKIYSPPAVPGNEQTRTLLRRELTEWQNAAPRSGGNIPRDARPVKTISIIFEPNSSYALATMTETVYDTNPDAEYFAHLNAKQVKIYNYITLDLATAQTAGIDQIAAFFTSANLATVAEMDYLYEANYKARSITGLATETRIKDAVGNVKAKSQIGYDESAVIFAGTVAQWQDPNTNYRGNATTTRSWTDIAANQFIETQAQYDNFGNLRKAWDARGNLSEVEYSSTYNYAYPTKTKSAIPDPSGATGANQAFETTTTFDFTTGKLISTTDANGQTSQIEYNDALLRPTKTIAPNGHQTITEYGAGTSAATRFVKVRTQIDQTKWQEGYSWYDGIGRAIKSQAVDSAGDVFTETEYDNMSRPKKATNPYRTGDTKLWTESFYDDLGRVTKIKTPDLAEVNTAYSLSITGANIGTVVTVTDQAGKQRRSMTNGLGQLTRVDEPNDSNQLGSVDAPVQPTLYSYDTLNNLIQVGQGAQTRSFAYDSLSRLKSATNPESGLINYGYDNNGNVLSKTDARGITTSFAYDNLNRVKTRSYADGGTTPPVSYYYDGIYYNAQNQLQQATGSVKGKLTGVYSIVSRTNYTAFDILGRVTAQQQITDANAYTTGYTYNLSGALIEETYPSTRVVKNVLDNDGDLEMVQSKKNANSGFFNYAKNFTYTSAGAVSSMQLGNGKWESTQFNSRLQPTQIALGTVQNGTDKLKLNFDYGMTNNNGNVLSQQITVPTVGANQGFTATQIYTYDSLNRLKSAVENIGATQTWKQTFTFDRYGNRNFDTANTTTLGSCPTNQCNPTIDTANNRFTTGQGYSFDLAGNLITDATGKSFVYDAENKQTSVTNTSGTIGTYLYDGDGKRVKKISAQETTIFVYDVAGKPIAEYSNQIASNPQVSYLTSDHLGSPRINTDANGNVIAKHDYLPFGEEISTPQRTPQLGYSADSIRQGFTGYLDDEESGLEYAQARMYATSHGRFTSPDQLLTTGRPYNPKSWNRYAYTLNNPLVFTDPTGLYECSGTEKQCKRFEAGLQKANEQLAKIEKRYGKDSKEYTDATRALKSYGTLGDKNGVTVGFGNLAQGTLGQTRGSLDQQGNKSIGVTIDLKQNENGSDLLTTIAHEGSHVQDHGDYQDALIAAGKSGEESKVMAVLNGVITHGASETRAFGVSSVFAEFTLGGAASESAITSGGGATTFSLGGDPVKSITVGGETIWKSSWQKLDIEKIRANRSAAIEKGLKKDPIYSPKLNKPIE